jgi:hypothetical protein
VKATSSVPACLGVSAGAVAESTAGFPANPLSKLGKIVGDELGDQTVQWLADDTFYRSRRLKVTHRKLGSSLNKLAAHLSLWRAKYEMWIPNIESHALVYLADEKHHGIAFPSGVDELVGAEAHGSQGAWSHLERVTRSDGAIPTAREY